MPKDKNVENVCCRHLGIIECGDTDAHSHIACSNLAVLPDNAHVKKHCLGAPPYKCPHYKKG